MDWLLYLWFLNVFMTLKFIFSATAIFLNLILPYLFAYSTLPLRYLIASQTKLSQTELWIPLFPSHKSTSPLVFTFFVKCKPYSFSWSVQTFWNCTQLFFLSCSSFNLPEKSYWINFQPISQFYHFPLLSSLFDTSFSIIPVDPPPHPPPPGYFLSFLLSYFLYSNQGY